MWMIAESDLLEEGSVSTLRYYNAFTSLHLNHVAKECFTSVLMWIACYFSFYLNVFCMRGVLVLMNHVSLGVVFVGSLSKLISLVLVPLSDAKRFSKRRKTTDPHNF